MRMRHEGEKIIPRRIFLKFAGVILLTILVGKPALSRSNASSMSNHSRKKKLMRELDTICKFFHAQDADELIPYMCRHDYAMSRAFGWGLERTMTIAEGFDRCDFRFKKGREEEKGWPPPSSIRDNMQEACSANLNRLTFQ